MICLNCFHAKTSVTNSRPHKKHPLVWRRRQCTNCKAIFTSYEKPTLDDQTVIDSSGNARKFNIGKLTISISKSFQHNKERADFASSALASTVESKLILRGKEISTDDIMAMTHTTLKNFDPIAALQYAAQHDLITLRKRPGRPATSSY